MLIFVARQVYVFGIEGKHYDSSGAICGFRFQHCFEFEPVPKYMIQLRQSVAGGKVKLVDVIYKTTSPDGGKYVFENAVQEMTNIVELEGREKGLKNILSIREGSGLVSGLEHQAAISDDWQAL